MAAPRPEPSSQDWLDSVFEDVIDPDAPIIDPHHHLWPAGGSLPYGLADLEADLGSVFVECGAGYDRSAGDAFAPVGETTFVTGEAERSDRTVMGGIVAHADLRDATNLDAVLDAHDAAGRGRFRGIRHAGSHALHPEALTIPGGAPVGLYADPAFRSGVARLGERGLTYDTWHYHYQNRDFLELARAVPDTTMVLDHFGTLGVGPYESQREQIFLQWTSDIADIAACENVVAKIGGLAMPDNGFGWHTAERPPTSDEFVEAQGRYYLHTIEQFGPERCMFESNFPVDRLSLSYRTVWNAFKKLVADFSADERDAMFRGTAARVYRL
jgi:L-fuconolactonase